MKGSIQHFAACAGLSLAAVVSVLCGCASTPRPGVVKDSHGSYEWLVGTWRCIETHWSDPDGRYLPDFTSLVVFPYTALTPNDPESGLEIAAELRHQHYERKAEECLIQMTGGSAMVWPRNLMIGYPIGWEFEYRHFTTRSTELLELTRKDENRPGILRARFKKVSADYGSPLSPLLPESHFPQWRKHADAYRSSRDLPRRGDSA